MPRKNCIPQRKCLLGSILLLCFCAVFVDDYPCGACAHQVKDEDKAVFCEGECQAWFHARCVNVNNEQYALTQKENGNAFRVRKMIYHLSTV